MIQACAAQLSDAALDWLMRKEIIRRKQSADVVAILRCISGWSGRNKRRNSPHKSPIGPLCPESDDQSSGVRNAAMGHERN